MLCRAALLWVYEVVATNMYKTFLFLDDLVIDADKITAIRPADKGKTNVWVIGQSAIDGAFLIDMKFEEVLKLWTGDEDGEVDSESNPEDES
jgi:hypothetical protein